MKKFERKAQSQPKHGPPSVSSASKATVLPRSRPEWSGSGHNKKAVRRPPVQAQNANPPPTVQEHIISIQLQQQILDTIRNTFPASNDFDALKPTLREIKDAIDEHDFDKAFATEGSLEAYAIRWSPSRALAYAHVLAWTVQEIKENGRIERGASQGALISATKAISFGRGVAEFMAFAALIKHFQSSTADEDVNSASPADKLKLTIVDNAANWSNVISKLHDTLTTPPTLSAYASAKARASNTAAFSSTDLQWTYTKVDTLELGMEQLQELIGPDSALVTLFFTLSELYSRSIPKTTKFLQSITATAPEGTLLLVIEHIGASVTKAVAMTENGEKEEKSYPLHWLLYQTLLPRKAATGQKDDIIEEQTPQWEKVLEDQNRIFKLPAGLRFPGSLENVKFQIHLLRRL